MTAPFCTGRPAFARLLAPFMLACALPAAAQDAPSTRLDPVVVTGSREPLAARHVAADVVVIDAERIRNTSADSVEDLLRRAAGLQLVRNGSPGANATLLIRGAGSGNTLVLVDGVRMDSATAGQPELEALSLAAIDRIEVLRGPASSLYGADGSGGVVQIFTRRGAAVPQASARVALGGYGAREAAVDAAGRPADTLDLAAGLSHERLDGMSALRPSNTFAFNPDTDGHRRSTAQARIGWQPAPQQRVGASLLDSRLEGQYDGSPDGGPSTDFRNRLHNRVAALDHRATWSPAWSTVLRTTTQDSDSHTGANEMARFRTQRQQQEAQATWKWAADQQLTLAWESLREQATSTSYDRPERRDNRAAVLAYAGSSGALSLQADLRHDDNTVYGSVRTGRLGAALALDGGWRLRALAGTSFRAPSFNDLFYPDYGVDTIQPERSRSVEVGADRRTSTTELSVTAYRNHARDLIAYEPDRFRCPDPVVYQFGCARNVARARLQGLTASARVQVERWDLSAVADLLDATDADTGERLNRRAAHQTSLGAEYDAGPWSAGADIIEVGARPDGNAKLGAETTVDLKARWRLSPHWTLQGKLLNALDRDIEPARHYQALGRQAWVGLRWDLQGR
jgi:vitamin B12 transporter